MGLRLALKPFNVPCAQFRPTSSLLNILVILEDTYLYKSDLNWTVHNEQSEDYDEYSQYDYEEWEDLTGEDQRRSYMVCDTDTLDVHWLRSKYIKLPKNYQQFEITIDIEYSFPKCREQGWFFYSFLSLFSH